MGCRGQFSSISGNMSFLFNQLHILLSASRFYMPKSRGQTICIPTRYILHVPIPPRLYHRCQIPFTPTRVVG